MFKFAKKNVEIEEQVLEDVTDEQLSQVTGGGVSFSSATQSALQAGGITATGAATESANVTGTSANATVNVNANASVTTPSTAASLTGTLGLSL